MVVYMTDTIGFTEANVLRAQAMHHLRDMLGIPAIIGADWNMVPAQVEAYCGLYGIRPPDDPGRPAPPPPSAEPVDIPGEGDTGAAVGRAQAVDAD